MNIQQRLIQLADGSLVEHDVLGIIERIYQYDPNLTVQYLDPSQAEFNDAPYRIVETCKDGFRRVVFSVWQLDERVMERLYNADTQKFNVMKLIESNNEKAKKEQNRRYQETRDEAKDIVEHVLKSSKGRYSFPRPDGAIVHLDDDPQRKYKVDGLSRD